VGPVFCATQQNFHAMDNVQTLFAKVERVAFFVKTIDPDGISRPASPDCTTRPKTVIPAKAGIQVRCATTIFKRSD